LPTSSDGSPAPRGVVGTASAAPRTLVVCATPRSGSGVLCEALTATRRAGWIDEYLHPAVAAHYAARWDVPPGPAWTARPLAEGRTPNGVLGVKVMWPDLERVLSGRGPVPAGFLAGCPGALVCVHLQRRDRLRQAISMWRAVATGAFRRRAGAPPPAERPLPEFWRPAIENRIREIEAAERAWAEWFAAAGGEPLRLVYEDDVAGRLEATLALVLDALGEPRAPVAAAPTYRRQADEWTERMIALFLAGEGAP
jgi:LPS sulfotransferase NodH